jgi:hypothetical protein
MAIFNSYVCLPEGKSILLLDYGSTPCIARFSVIGLLVSPDVHENAVELLVSKIFDVNLHGILTPNIPIHDTNIPVFNSGWFNHQKSPTSDMGRAQAQHFTEPSQREGSIGGRELVVPRRHWRWELDSRLTIRSR